MSGNSLPEDSAEALITRFWSAPSEALFSQAVIGAVLDLSESWCERSRFCGGGPKFIKIGRSVLYRKSDVVAFINSHATVSTTSEYQAAAA